jgi:hypothetical protein
MTYEDLAPIQKAMKFGPRRTLRVLEHQQNIRVFLNRQYELAAIAVFNLIFFVCSGYSAPGIFFLVIGLTCIAFGTSEARRMLACGRFHQCNRSLEVVGI